MKQRRRLNFQKPSSRSNEKLNAVEQACSERIVMQSQRNLQADVQLVKGAREAWTNSASEDSLKESMEPCLESFPIVDEVIPPSTVSQKDVEDEIEAWNIAEHQTRFKLLNLKKELEKILEDEKKLSLKFARLTSKVVLSANPTIPLILEECSTIVEQMMKENGDLVEEFNQFRETAGQS